MCGAYIAVIIAAGLSSRMGKFKPLIDVGGKAALFRLLDTIEASGLKRAVVVTGHRHALIEAALRQYSSIFPSPAAITSSFDNNAVETTSFFGCSSPVTSSSSSYSAPAFASSFSVGGLSVDTVYNAAYESGMFSSVQAGIRYITGKALTAGGNEAAVGKLSGEDLHAPADDTRAALLFPADVPLVSAETICGLIFAYEQGASSRFAVPVYEGKNGHPLLIPRKYFSEIIDHTGEGGLKEIRNRHLGEMLRYEADDEGCVLDMDTPEDYEQILTYEKRQNER